MKNLHKITNIALIFVVIGSLSWADFAYAVVASHLRVPIIDDAKRKKEALELEKVLDLEYIKRLSDSIDALGAHIRMLRLYIDGLFHEVSDEKRQEILKKFGKIPDPNDMGTAYRQALEIFLETNEPVEYIREGEEKIRSYRKFFSKVSVTCPLLTPTKHYHIPTNHKHTPYESLPITYIHI